MMVKTFLPGSDAQGADAADALAAAITHARVRAGAAHRIVQAATRYREGASTDQ
jgi:Holliday junction resolvasome RuvABC endonuclease subunit